MPLGEYHQRRASQMTRENLFAIASQAMSENHIFESEPRTGRCTKCTERAIFHERSNLESVQAALAKENSQ